MPKRAFHADPFGLKKHDSWGILKEALKADKGDFTGKAHPVTSCHFYPIPYTR